VEKISTINNDRAPANLAEVVMYSCLCGCHQSGQDILSDRSFINLLSSLLLLIHAEIHCH